MTIQDNKNALVIRPPEGVIPTARRAAEEALALLLEDSRSEATRKAYEGDLKTFFRWFAGTEPTPEAVARLCSMEAGDLAITLNRYKASLRERNLAEATINRRLAALRSLLRMARRFGAAIPDPAGLVTSEKAKAYRDTRGPALREAKKLLSAPDRGTLKGKRDFALLLLFCENALRRNEIRKCDVGDFRPGERRLYILGKGRGSEREPVTLTPEAAAALSDYLAARGNPEPDAPLFSSAARFVKGERRLSGFGLYHIVQSYGRKVLGRPLHPHALRHMAITAFLDAGGDIRSAQRLSRHADVRTLQRYDDNREDLQGQATAVLSRLLLSPEGEDNE